MSGFALGYDANLGGTCRCGEQVDAVHVEIDDQATCSFCAERRLPAFAKVADALDDIDTALFRADDVLRPTLVGHAFQMLTAIMDARVPAPSAAPATHPAARDHR